MLKMDMLDMDFDSSAAAALQQRCSRATISD
jgi:hypothetical protein